MMASLPGFIQLLLVLVPVGNKKQSALLKEAPKPGIAAVAIEAGNSMAPPVWLPVAVLPKNSAAVTQDDKGLPAVPFTLLGTLLDNYTASGQTLSNKPLRSCPLYILYCQLKSDC